MLPKFIELTHVAQCIHRLPKAGMLKRHKLAIGGDANKRFGFPACVRIIDIVEHAW